MPKYVEPQRRRRRRDGRNRHANKPHHPRAGHEESKRVSIKSARQQTNMIPNPLHPCILLLHSSCCSVLFRLPYCVFCNHQQPVKCQRAIIWFREKPIQSLPFPPCRYVCWSCGCGCPKESSNPVCSDYFSHKPSPHHKMSIRRQGNAGLLFQ